MKRNLDQQWQRVGKVAMIVGAAMAVVVILWIDVATGIWQNLVILSGLAAGLVSFFLTSLVLRSIIARETAKRWAPVNRLAITEFLHAIADAEHSEVAHGIIVPRSLPALNIDQNGMIAPSELHALREATAAERRDLSDALSRWAEFLTTSGDNEAVLQHVARIAFQLDQVRDTALECESDPSSETRDALITEVEACNAHFTLLVKQLKHQLDEDNAFELGLRRSA